MTERILPMRIAFLGETSHPNAQVWIQALQETMPCAIVTWSLPSDTSRRYQWMRALALISAALRMKRTVAELSPDLLIAYRTTSYGFLAALSGFHPFVAAAQGETDAWPPDSWLVGLKRWMARICLRHADLIHAWGDHIAEEQVRLGAPPDKILVRPRGADLRTFYPPPGGHTVDLLRLVCTRSLFPEYGHQVILDAIASVAARGIPISLDVAGDGALLRPLRDHATALGIADAVRFHGAVPHERLPELLRQCNVYIAMPITEGVSASLFEAMASGCYPIVTDLVANRAWVTPSQNGSLVPVGDRQALEHALLRLWADRSAIARAAALNVQLMRERASLQDNVALFARSYQQLVANASASRRV